jgi:hypothetical protein
MGMVSMAVAFGVTALSSRAAQAFHRADLIESLQETVAQPDSHLPIFTPFRGANAVHCSRQRNLLEFHAE